MGYSKDLRRCVIQFIQNGGGKAEASRLFGVGESTIYLWMKTPERCQALKTGPKQNWKLNLSQLSKAVEERPDAYLSELAEIVGTGISTVYYGLKKLKLSRKKNQSLRGKKRKRAQQIQAGIGTIEPCRSGLRG